MSSYANALPMQMAGEEKGSQIPIIQWFQLLICVAHCSWTAKEKIFIALNLHNTSISSNSWVLFQKLEIIETSIKLVQQLPTWNEFSSSNLKWVCEPVAKKKIMGNWWKIARNKHLQIAKKIRHSVNNSNWRDHFCWSRPLQLKWSDFWLQFN